MTETDQEMALWRAAMDDWRAALGRWRTAIDEQSASVDSVPRAALAALITKWTWDTAGLDAKSPAARYANAILQDLRALIAAQETKP